jgi:hypothetical protein
MHNFERLTTPYDPNKPIETLFQKIQDARAFEIAGIQPYGDAMIIHISFTLIFNTGLFSDACRALQVHSIAQKTWTNSKVDFLAANRKCCLTNQTAQ